MTSSHINPLSSFQPYKPFGSGFNIFQAEVINNEDPDKLGRIKCSIPDLLPGSDPETLPWIFPLFPAGLGSGTYFSVPEVGSNVILMSPEGSIYKMFYAWNKVDKRNDLSDFSPNYPESYGEVDSAGNKRIVNKDPSINTIDVTWSDGSKAKEDSKNSVNTFSDSFGSSVSFDRKNQSFNIKYGTLEMDFSDGTLTIKCPDIIIQDSSSFKLTTPGCEIKLASTMDVTTTSCDVKAGALMKITAAIIKLN